MGATLFYFLFFLVLLPLIGLIENKLISYSEIFEEEEEEEEEFYSR